MQERTLTVGFEAVDGSCDEEAVDAFGFGTADGSWDVEVADVFGFGAAAVALALLAGADWGGLRVVVAAFGSVGLGTPAPVLCSVILDVAAAAGFGSVAFDAAAAGLGSALFVVAAAADDGLGFGVTLDRVVPVAAAAVAAGGFLVAEAVAVDGDGLVEAFGEAAAAAAVDGLVDGFGEAFDGEAAPTLGDAAGAAA